MPGGRDLTTPQGILEAALAREEAAYRFYDRLLQSVTVPFIRELLERLKDEEFKHRRLIEDKLASLRLGHDV
jgi:rubrerythrin